MKRINIRFLLLLLSILMTFPIIIDAKENCEKNDLKIKDISYKEIIGGLEQVSNPIVDYNTINLNLKMYNVGDSILYSILIENNSDEDYYFTKNSFKANSDYMDYIVDNSNNYVKAHHDGIVQLKIIYKKQIPDDSYNEIKDLSLFLSNKEIVNPQTKRNVLIVSFVLLFCFITFLNLNCIKIKKKNLMFIGIISLIPINAYAICTIHLDIKANIQIDNKEAIFLPGEEVNVRMKQLAGDDTSTVTNRYSYQNQSIIAIKKSLAEPSENKKQDSNIVSIPESPYPIYMWYTDGTIYWWSEARRPKLNTDASKMFRNFSNLNDLSGLSMIDASNATTLQTMFAENYGLENLNGVENWDTSNVTTLVGTFALNTSSYNAGHRSPLKDITALRNWDISNVTTLNQVFQNTTALINLEGLENWNTSNVTTMQNTFGLMKGVVKDDNGIMDLSPLANWDVSSVTNMTALFQNNNILSYEPLAKWDTKNVMYFTNTFNQSYYSTTKTLKGLENWDVSSATTFSTMFQENVSLIDASAINNWNINSTMNFEKMFNNTPTYPNFSKISGVWNVYGTFIPTN